MENGQITDVYSYFFTAKTSKQKKKSIHPFGLESTLGAAGGGGGVTSWGMFTIQATRYSLIPVKESLNCKHICTSFLSKVVILRTRARVDDDPSPS